MTAEDIINKFGGTSALARLLSLNASTVDSWRASNSIPKWRQDDILEAALANGVQISTGDFPPPKQRKQAA
jgi:hypothetical protein